MKTCCSKLLFTLKVALCCVVIVVESCADGRCLMAGEFPPFKSTSFVKSAEVNGLVTYLTDLPNSHSLNSLNELVIISKFLTPKVFHHTNSSDDTLSFVEVN